MITWPIFLALFLAVIAVYFSIKHDDAKEEKMQQEEEKENLKQADLEKNSFKTE